MVEKLVALHNEEPRISTFDIFNDLGYSEHRFMKRIVSDNKEHFSDLGFLPLERTKPKKGSRGGRPDESYFLNEDQFTLLILLCKNTPQTVDLKFKIAKQFGQMKKMLLKIKTQQQNASWIEDRKKGIVTRKESTDIIKDFIDYAISQGSKSAERYYGNITRMENKALFVVENKYKNLRNVLDGQQLAVLNTCDQIVSKSLRDGMAEIMHYKEIYKKAKADVESLVELMGKTKVPSTKLLS